MQSRDIAIGSQHVYTDFTMVARYSGAFVIAKLPPGEDSMLPLGQLFYIIYFKELLNLLFIAIFPLYYKLYMKVAVMMITLATLMILQ